MLDQGEIRAHGAANFADLDDDAIACVGGVQLRDRQSRPGARPTSRRKGRRIPV